ncbi:MAG: DUF1178 family protein [Inquilinus sp.]|nr:DUF1178 family protein [Inquilinus sp.]
MILFDLRCRDGHGFEAWFKNGATYDDQVAAGIVSCPVCGSTAVEKAPMAPRILKGQAGRSGPDERAGSEGLAASGDRPVAMGQIREKLTALRRHVEENSDDVGKRFAEEARRIHYGEVPHRDIHGSASDDQAAELADEGVAFTQIPWITRSDS